MNTIHKHWLLKLLFIFVAMQGNSGNRHFFVFDNLLPSTSFTTVLHLTMHIAGELRALQQEDIHDHDRELVLDIITGRIVRLHALVHEQKSFVHEEDMTYMLHSLDLILEMYPQIDSPVTTYVVALLYEARSYIASCPCARI